MENMKLQADQDGDTKRSWREVMMTEYDQN